jgi:hypothetical protein
MVNERYITMSYPGRRWVGFDDVLALRETPKALLCEIQGIQVWVPRSQIATTSEVQWLGDFGQLRVTEWWAKRSDIEANVEAVSELPTAKRVYRKLVGKYHPDRNPKTAEVMCDINELWQAFNTDRGTK